MRQEQKQLKLNVKSITKDEKVINQQTLTVTKHSNNKKYLMISKNDFGKNLRINAGIFNKKTRFIVTEKHSIIALNMTDPKNGKIEEISIQNFKNSNSFLIYAIPIFTIKQNYQIEFKDLKNNKEYKIDLNFELGRAFGRKMKNNSSNQTTITPIINNEQQLFLDTLIPDISKNEKINFDKRILISSNYKFLLGILYELYEEKLIIENINIYLITSILNMLGASYSIRRQEESNNFYIRFKLPIFFKKYLKNLKYLKNPKYNGENGDIYNKKLKMIRNKKYIIDHKNGKIENVKLINYNEFKQYYFDSKFALKKDKKLIDYINLGLYELMPVNDFKFIPIEYGEVYDFVTEGIEGATNYILPGLPLLKNSDGDILALIGIWTEDAARDAEKKFGFNKKTVISELDGKPFNWIDIDSILGLYNFTK